MSGSHVKCTDPDHHGCPLCTAPADAHLEAAMRNLRMKPGKVCTILGNDESAALLAKIEAADRLASMAEDVRQRFIDFAPAPGDLFAIEALRQEIAAYRNPQPAAEGEGK